MYACSNLLMKGTDEEIIKQNQEDLKRRLEQNQEDLKRRLEQNQKDLKRRLEELEKQYYANEQRETQISRNATVSNDVVHKYVTPIV